MYNIRKELRKFNEILDSLEGGSTADAAPGPEAERSGSGISPAANGDRAIDAHHGRSADDRPVKRPGVVGGRSGAFPPSRVIDAVRGTRDASEREQGARYRRTEHSEFPEEDPADAELFTEVRRGATGSASSAGKRFSIETVIGAGAHDLPQRAPGTPADSEQESPLQPSSRHSAGVVDRRQIVGPESAAIVDSKRSTAIPRLGAGSTASDRPSSAPSSAPRSQRPSEGEAAPANRSAVSNHAVFPSRPAPVARAADRAAIPPPGSPGAARRRRSPIVPIPPNQLPAARPRAETRQAAPPPVRRIRPPSNTALRTPRTEDRHKDLDALIDDLRSSLNRSSVSLQPSNPMQKARASNPAYRRAIAIEPIGRRSSVRAMALVAAGVALVVPAALVAVVFLSPGRGESDEFASVATTTSGEPVLSVTTQPHGARVYLNNVFVGVTPFENVAVEPGDYLVTTERDGYVQSDTVLSIRGATNFAFSLSPLLDTGRSASGHVLAGMENPSDAGPADNGPARSRPAPSRAVRSTPSSSPVRAGGTIERLQPVVGASISRAPAVGTEADVSTGGIVVNSEPTAATVWIDGQVAGETPIDLSGIREGSHSVQITRPNFENFETTIDVVGGSTLPLDVALQPIVGTIAVIVQPEGTVYVDGVLRGRGVQGLARFEVAPGSHKLRVVNDELGTREFDVDVRPNREAEYNVTFAAPPTDQGTSTDIRRALGSTSDPSPAVPSASDATNPADGDLTEADRRFAEGDLEAARRLYRSLAESDPSNSRVINKLAEVERLLRTQQEQAATEAIIEDGVYLVVDKSPQLIGGLEALHRTVRYPEAALNAGIEGRVFVQFVVDEQGVPTDVTVTKGLPMGCNEAAIDAVKEARFIPGEYNGRKVKVRHTLFINFRK